LTRSSSLLDRARQVIPGGVNSPVRAFGAVGGNPPFIRRGEGPFLYDADGNRYIDYVCSWGPLILGHRHPRVVEAVQEALADGTSFGAPTEREVVLAEMLVAALPAVESVRLVNSGTEATASALRLARAYTGRTKIVKFEGCYHGHVDYLLLEAGSGALTFGTPTTPGIPPAAAQETFVLPYNDPAALAELFSRHGRKIAAVIVEPVAGNMGCVPPDPGFLSELRRLTQENGAVLIFDEVITGFRVAYRGAQGLYGIYPDLTCLGKIIGGGLPVGGFGGRREIMRLVAPSGPVYQAGTLSGNPLAVAAGLATLTVLKEEDPYGELDRKAEMLAQGLAEAAKEAEVAVTVNRAASMLTVFFSSEKVKDKATATKSDTRRFARFFHGMLRRGVYLPPSQFECWFLSTAHGESEIKYTIDAARETFQEISE
jgi:glutamate-1-semialdehyde 2,1-aminomutase